MESEEESEASSDDSEALRDYIENTTRGDQSLVAGLVAQREKGSAVGFPSHADSRGPVGFPSHADSLGCHGGHPGPVSLSGAQ